MKIISEHLGRIIVALACVALLISTIVVFDTPVSDFFGNVIDKETNIAQDMVDSIETAQAGLGGTGGSGGSTEPVYGVNDPALNHSGTIPNDATYTYFTGPRSCSTCGYEFTETESTCYCGQTSGSCVATVLTAGQGFPATVSNGDIYIYGDYEYRYNQNCSGGAWSSTQASQNGWGVRVLDTSKASYGAILESINGKSITSLKYTFYRCRSFEKAPSIPSGVTVMSSTFDSCDLLSDISNVTIPNGVTKADMLFKGCTSLTDASGLVFSSTVTTIGSAFVNCSSLTKAPDLSKASSLTNMASTFSGCTSLTDISNLVIPNGVTNMGSTFGGCTALTDASGLVIPNSVKTMTATFGGCTALTGSLTINATPSSYSQCLRNTQITEILGDCTNKSTLLATK